MFLNCYFKSSKTNFLFNELIANKKTDFSRYNYFYAKYLDNQGKKIEATKIVESALKKYPRNLLLNHKKLYY